MRRRASVFWSGVSFGLRHPDTVALCNLPAFVDALVDPQASSSATADNITALRLVRCTMTLVRPTCGRNVHFVPPHWMTEIDPFWTFTYRRAMCPASKVIV